MQLPFQDISYAQGNYNMGANNDQIIAIRMSSGDGGLHFDTQATKNYNAASKAGKVIIQYHFAGSGDPIAEAKFFLEACSPFAENDVYCLDHETGQTLEWCQTFMSVVHAATGAWPLDYRNISLANSMPLIPNCGLWLAAPSWGFNQTITELRTDITYVAQQGPIVNGVDSDMWFGTLEALKAYGYHAPSSSPPPPTPTPTPTPPPIPPPTPEPTPTPPAPVPPPVTPAPSKPPVIIQPTGGVGLLTLLLNWLRAVFKGV